MKLVKVLCCMLLFCFLALTLHKTQQLFTTGWETNQQKRVGYVIHALCVTAKQKIVQGRGPSNINLGSFVCSFDVFRASYPVPSLLTMVQRTHFITGKLIE